MDKILEIENLRVSYHTYAGEVQSVRGVSFDVKAKLLQSLENPAAVNL